MDKTVLLALHRVSFLQIREKLLLLETVPDRDVFAELRITDIMQIVNRKIRRKTWNARELISLAEQDEQLLEEKDIRYSHYWDRTYPPQLREIFDPPFGLFYRGNLPDYNSPVAGMVGTRRPTERALQGAFSIAFELGIHSIAVVSGLAAGIDGAAHRGNLEGGGKTIAVLGNGIDSVYPKSHRSLAEDILSGSGVLISEYPPGELPLKHHFPQRNRIISGLSRTVVLVQAPVKSGALITADFALEQGRDLVVFQDSAKGNAGQGGALLIEQGAQAVGTAAEIIGEWGHPGTAPCNAGGGNRGPVGLMMARLLEKELSGELVRAYGMDFERRKAG